MTSRNIQTVEGWLQIPPESGLMKARMGFAQAKAKAKVGKTGVGDGAPLTFFEGMI